MTGSPAIAGWIETLIAELDYFRCSPSRFGGPGGHKEWQHFIVHTDRTDLLVNFNVFNDRWAISPDRREAYRVICIGRTSEGWVGGIDRFDSSEVELRSGDVGARFGTNTLAFEQGQYRLSVRLRDGSFEAELTLVPLAVPMLASNQPLSRARSVSWLFVPRLECSGYVSIGNQRLDLEAASAYHDHNWGNFAWGEDFAWEWGATQDDGSGDCWSMVFARMSDRGRNVVRGQGLFVWKGARFHRLFRDDELELQLLGRLGRQSALRLPPIMGLLSNAVAHDLPEALRITAKGSGDSLDAVFYSTEAAQIIMPNETDVDSVTVLNEVLGHVVAHGSVRGSPVKMEGPAVFEFIRP